MGSSNGISRGQLRPHFSGRSPPLLVATLCVGLGILGVSYWSLSQQYNSMESQFRSMIQKKEGLEEDENVIKNQLHLREEAYSKAKKQLQDKEQEIQLMNNQLKSKEEQVNSLNAQVETIKESNTKCGEDLSKKENEVGDVNTKIKELREEKAKLLSEKEDAMKQLNSVKEENELLKKQLDESKKQQPLSVAVNPPAQNDSNSLSNAEPNQVSPAQSRHEADMPVHRSPVHNEVIPEQASDEDSAKNRLELNEPQANDSNRVLEAPKFDEPKSPSLTDQISGQDVSAIQTEKSQAGSPDLVESDKKSDALMEAAAADGDGEGEGKEDSKDNDESMN